jgi:menaquinone-dependent protoporphyrinogen IX oxidase
MWFYQRFQEDGVDEVDYVKLLEEQNMKDESENALHMNMLQIEDNDLMILRACLLFQNWEESTFMQFVEDHHVILRQFKYVLMI